MKKVAISVVVIVVVALAAGLIFGRGSDDASTDSTSTSQDSSNAVENNTRQTEVSDARYVKYSEQAFNDASDKNRVLFFHAPWCPTCNFYKDELQNNDIPEDIVFFEADYDNDDTLKDRYNVNVQSTFVLVDADGETIRTWPFGGNLNDAAELFEAIKSEV